jgi:uncharacterized protein with LGFP repeats
VRRSVADRARAHDRAHRSERARAPRRAGRGATNAVLLSVLTPAAFLTPLAAPSAPAQAEPVTPEVVSVPVAGVDDAALAALGLPSRGEDAPDLLTAELSTREFSTLGVSWERDADLGEVEVSVRIRTDGIWSYWEDLHAEEADGPDLVETPQAPVAVGPEAPVIGAASTTPKADVTVTTVERQSTPPVWAGPSDGVQVRLYAEGDVPRGVEVELVDPGTSPADATVGQVAPGTAHAATAQPAIVTRKQWGADEGIRRGSPSYSSRIKAGILHHTVNSNDYTKAQAPALVRSIYAYHVKSNGWSDVGYNYLVDRFGTIYEGRAGGLDKAVVGAHAAGFNADTFGVSIIGDFTSTAPPAAALSAVQRLMAWKLSLHGLDPNATTTLTSAGGGTARYAAGKQVSFKVVSGHRDGNLTACPGAQLYPLLPQIRTGVKAAMSGGSSAPTKPAPPKPTPAKTSSGAATEDIGAAYARLGGAASALGAATTAALPTRDGKGWYRHFRGGSIYWSPGIGAREVRGAIHGVWSRQGWENGPLGYPLTDESPAADGQGRYNHFQNGSIYWHPATGAHEVRGALRDVWQRTGWEKGTLGYPVTGHLTTPDGAGRYTHFQRGSVYWSPTTGAHEVYGAIRQAWARSGWELGPLGYPVSGEYDVPGGRANDFQKGRLVWNRATGAVTRTAR